MRRPTSLFATLFTGAIALLPQHSLADAPQVVTSIKPLELLVRAVATDDTRITSLVPSGASPHTYQMRPSQRRALESADRIFWVGPDMETFLIRLLSSDDFQGRQVALMEEPNDRGDIHAQQEHAELQHDDHSGGHHHGEGEDPHVWLDPQQALAMAHDIRDQLSRLPGADKTALNSNLVNFEQQLHATELDIRQRLRAAKGISLYTYHDAFRRFAEHYDLEIAGVLTLNPERSPGARHMAELRQQLKSSPSPCLLTEPQFNRQWWQSITEGIDVVISTWDPLASDIPTTPTGYIDFQNAMANAVLACLPEQTQH